MHEADHVTRRRNTLDDQQSPADPPRDQPSSAGTGRARPGRRPLTWSWRGPSERLGLVFLWAILCIFFSVLPATGGRFATLSNFASIGAVGAVAVVVTLAAVVPLRAGDYDLSVAYNLSLSSVIVVMLNSQAHMNVWLALVITLLIGALIGVANGVITVLFNVNSLIATLGTGSFLEGISLWISGGNTVSGLSSSLTQAVLGGRLFGIPYEFYYALILTLLMWLVFSKLPVGRRLLYIGVGKDVARLSGVRVSSLRFGAFVASGVLSAFAGVLYAGGAGAADPTSGISFLLPAFAAAFLSATTITPGQFNPMGAFIAVYFLGTGVAGLELLGGQSYVQFLFYGGALVVAVVASQLIRRRRNR